MGEHNRALRRYEIASKMEEVALTVRQELLGKEHPDTLASVNDLENVVKSSGQV